MHISWSLLRNLSTTHPRDCPKYSRRPVDSIRDAVFTVSPKRQYRGMVSPTTPATQGPERHVISVTQKVLHKVRVSLTSKSHPLLWYSKTTWEYRIVKDLIGFGACYKQSKIKHCSRLHIGVLCLTKVFCGRTSVHHHLGEICSEFTEAQGLLQSYLKKNSFSIRKKLKFRCCVMPCAPVKQDWKSALDNQRSWQHGGPPCVPSSERKTSLARLSSQKLFIFPLSHSLDEIHSLPN